jgi:hypothetical protein
LVEELRRKVLRKEGVVGGVGGRAVYLSCAAGVGPRSRSGGPEQMPFLEGAATGGLGLLADQAELRESVKGQIDGVFGLVSAEEIVDLGTSESLGGVAEPEEDLVGCLVSGICVKDGSGGVASVAPDLEGSLEMGGENEWGLVE